MGSRPARRDRPVTILCGRRRNCLSGWQPHPRRALFGRLERLYLGRSIRRHGHGSARFPRRASRGPFVSADRFRAATPLTRTAAGRFRSSAWGSPRPGRCEVSTSGQAKRSRRRLRSCPVRRILFPRSMSPRFSEAGSSPGSLEQGSNGGSVHHPRRIRRRFVALSGRAHQQPEHADRRRHQRRRNAPHPRCGQIVGRSGCR